MNHPSGPAFGPFPSQSGAPAGCGPDDRPQGRRMRQRQRGGGGFGPGSEPGFGSGFGPGFGPGFGAGDAGHRRRGGRRRGHHHRGRRGDVRAAILVLLADRPMHGYEMIQQIAERSGDLWRPSPGSVYPTLQMLVDEGLITGDETQGSKRVFQLTDEGRVAAEAIGTPPWQHITDEADPGQVSLRTAIDQLFGAVGQAAYVADPERQQRIVDIINKARRDVYTILGEAD